MLKIEKIILDYLKRNDNPKSYIKSNIIYNINGLPKWIGGRCEYNFLSCTIYIKPEKKNDKGALNHELMHSKQFSRLLWLHILLVNYNELYNLYMELQAYRVQIKDYNYTEKYHYDSIVKSLSKGGNYGMHFSKERVQELCDYMFEDIILNKKNSF